VATAVGATSPSGGLCGLNGSLPLIPSDSIAGHSLTTLDLSNNQLTGQLPSSLVWLAAIVSLQNNKFSGSIPGAVGRRNGRLQTARVTELDLSGNQLKVRGIRHRLTLVAHLPRDMAGVSCSSVANAIECTDISSRKMP
jgi:hypothetical protein